VLVDGFVALILLCVIGSSGAQRDQYVGEWWANIVLVVCIVCRKRRSPSGARPEDYVGEWSDVETRCSVAIEGHAAAKYVQASIQAQQLHDVP